MKFHICLDCPNTPRFISEESFLWSKSFSVLFHFCIFSAPKSPNKTQTLILWAHQSQIRDFSQKRLSDASLHIPSRAKLRARELRWTDRLIPSELLSGPLYHLILVRAPDMVNNTVHCCRSCLGSCRDICCEVIGNEKIVVGVFFLRRKAGE